MAVNADGVHVGQHDMEAGQVREKIGPDKILGVSAQTVEQALRAQAAGADYLGVGAVFPTGTKDDADAVSYDTLKAICEAVDIPVVAIGGIGAHNVQALAGSGICGTGTRPPRPWSGSLAASLRRIWPRTSRRWAAGRPPSTWWLGSPSPAPRSR